MIKTGGVVWTVSWSPLSGATRQHQTFAAYELADLFVATLKNARLVHVEERSLASFVEALNNALES